MNKILVKNHKTDYGELILGSYDNQLCLCDWYYRKMRQNIDKRLKEKLDAEFDKGESQIIHDTIEQLTEYFNGERKDFDIPLLFAGSDFQQRVWAELLKIPYGETETYLGLSHRLGNEKAIRAVASANGANAISIIVPCHRIIGSNGDLIGYAGGLSTKKKLLILEGGIDQSEQLELFT